MISSLGILVCMWDSLLGTVKVGAYCYLPIPFVLMVVWVVAGVLKGFGSGIVASLVYRS